MKKKTLFLLLTFFLINFIFSIDDNLIKKFKDSQTMIPPYSYTYILYSSKTLTLNQDKKILEKEVLDFYKIINSAGRDMFSDYRIRFKEEKDKINVLEALTIKKDLKKIPVENKAINTITPTEHKGASLYSNILDKVYSFQNVEPYDAVFMNYVKETPVIDGFIASKVLFQGENPKLSMNFRVKIPQNLSLFNKLSSKKIEQKIDKHENYKIYTWEMKDIPKFKIEEYRPPSNYLSPYLIFSTSKDWSNIVTKLYNEFHKKTKPDSLIKKKARELIKEEKSDKGKILKIYKFITKDIKKITLPLGQDGYYPHKASKVLKNFYGDIRDKSSLLISLLKAAKFKPFPVFVPDTKTPEKELVVMDQFKTIFVAVPLNGELIFLNPNGENEQLGYVGVPEGTEGLAIKQGKLEWIKINYHKNIKNRSCTEIKIKMLQNVLYTADINVDINGYFDKIAREGISLKSENEKKKFFSKSANVFSEGSKSISYTLSNLKDSNENVKINHLIKGSTLFVKQGKVSILTLPEVPYFFADFPFRLSLKTRNYPLYFGKKFEVYEKWNLQSDKNIKALYLPDNLNIDNEKYSFYLKVKTEDNSITIERSIKIKTLVLPLSEYKKFKDIFDKFYGWKMKTLLFEEE